MKNKAICIISCLFVLIITFFVSIHFNEKKSVYHQHIEKKNHAVCNEADPSFCTHLPIVSIETDNQEIPGEARDGSVITVNVNLYNKEEDVNHLTDEPEVSSLANIKYRGNSSMHFDKKGYSIKFVNKEGKEKKVSVMGMPKDEEWVLHGPFLDKTLIRNYMWYNISHEIMGYAPNTRFCELFVDGKYLGVYVMVESVSRGEESRIPISKYNPKHSYTSYIVRFDRGSNGLYDIADSFTSYTYNNNSMIDIVYPGKEKLTKELNEYITNDISKFEKTLYSFDYDSRRYGYKNYIDIDSFVNYYIINEFTQNYDAGIFSTYLYKDAKGKFGLYVWDFNNAIDNYQDEDAVYNYNYDYQLQNRTWFHMLFKDEDFTERVINRYKHLRETYLSEEYITKYIDETIAYLGPAIDRNFKVWGYTFEEDCENMLSPSTRNLHSYEEAVNQMKERLIFRGEWMDKTIETIRQYSHESKVKKYNH